MPYHRPRNRRSNSTMQSTASGTPAASEPPGVCSRASSRIRPAVRTWTGRRLRVASSFLACEENGGSAIRMPFTIPGKPNSAPVDSLSRCVMSVSDGQQLGRAPAATCDAKSCGHARQEVFAQRHLSALAEVKSPADPATAPHPQGVSQFGNGVADTVAYPVLPDQRKPTTVPMTASAGTPPQILDLRRSTLDRLCPSLATRPSLAEMIYVIFECYSSACL
jgi:hypothetical protein